MQRRRLLAGLGAGLAAGLAGCGDDADDGTGGDGGEPGGDDATPAEPGDETPFADAPWRDGDGLDAETLAERHVTALDEAGGFTLFSTADSTHEGDEEPDTWLPSQEYVSRFELARERQYLRQELLEGEEVERSEAYVADGEAFFREQVGDRVAYDRQELDRSTEEFRRVMEREASTGVYVERENADGDVRAEGLTQWNLVADGEGDVDGERTARFVADAFDGDRDVPEQVDTAAATVQVFEAGLVPRIEQSWTGTHADVPASVDIGIHYRDLGAAIDEPEWVPEAREATGDDE